VVDLIGKAKVVSWASEAGDAINKLLGGGGQEQYAGHALAEAHGTVQVDGTVETGLTRHQTLTLDWNPDWSLDDPLDTIVMGTSDLGTTFSLSYKELENQLVQELRNAERMLALYGVFNTTLRDFYEGEIDRIKNELDAANLAYQVTDPNTGLPQVIYPRRSVLTVTVDPIWAQAGIIDVRADQLQGSGVFIAPGDASVTIYNNTPAFLEIKGITIPAVNGGLFYNGELMTQNAVINGKNQNNAAEDNAINFDGVDALVVPGVAEFDEPLPVPGSGSNPTVIVRNTLDVNGLIPPGDPAGSYPWPDITVLGPADGGQGIYNDNGQVLLETLPSGTGRIRIEGTIRAQDLTVIAGGDAFIDGLSTYPVGGEPADVLGPATTGTYGGYNIIYEIVFIWGIPFKWPVGIVAATAPGVKEASGGAVAEVVNNPPQEPYSLYGDRIHISAEFININGIMQSGRDSYELVLDAAAYQEASALQSAGQAGRLYLAQTSKNNPGFAVYFNTATQRFEVNELKTSGGFIELFGHILNTGYGEIRVLGGYTDVQINNTTNVDIVLNRLDVSERGTGTLVVVDKGNGYPELASRADVGTEGPYVTVYQWTPTGVTVTTDGGTGSSQVVTSTTYQSQYQPAAGWRYGWTTVVEQNVIKKKHIKSGSWLGVIPDVFQKENIQWDSIEVQGTPHYAGSGPYYYFEDNAATADEWYTYTKESVTLDSTGPVRVYHDDYWTWYGSHVYVEDWQEIEGQEVLHTHTVNAHQSIKITFIGQPEGGVTVDSVGSVMLQGAILNPNGTTTITSHASILRLPGEIWIGGRRVVLSAGMGIGTEAAPLNIDVADILYSWTNLDGVQLLNTPAFKFDTTQGSQDLKPYDRVRLDEDFTPTLGKPGSVYEYVGESALLDLAVQNYRDTALWKELVPTRQDIIKVGNEYYIYLGPPAKLDLGSQNYLDTSRWQPVDLRPSLKATTQKGGVYLEQVSGDLPIDQVSALSGDTVQLAAKGAILVAQQNSSEFCPGLVSGGSLVLTAREGGIGNSADLPLVLDSGVLAAGATTAEGSLAVTVSANGDVFLKEQDGDLWLNELVTTGKAWIWVPNGSLYDANMAQTRDDRTYETLKNGVWSDLQLTDSTGAQEKIANTINSYASQKEREYHTYWLYRNLQPDPETYDPDFVVPFTSQEQAAYEQYYTDQGIEMGLSGEELDAFVQNAIATLENSRTTQYHTLHAQFAAYFDRLGQPFPTNHNEYHNYQTYWRYRNTQDDPETYDPSFIVQLSDNERSYYESFYQQEGKEQGLSGEALENYVADQIAVIETERTTEYHELHAVFAAYFSDLGEPFPTSYDPALRFFVYQLSQEEEAALVGSIKVWTEDDLLHLIGAGLLKSVTDTEVYVENSNIEATEITLITSGSIGRTGGRTTILIDGHKFTDEERVALAAAERADVAFLSGSMVDAVVNFDANARSLTRTDGLDWSELSAGMFIRIQGNTANATEGLDYYTVQSIDGATLYLSAADELVSSEVGKAVTVAPIVLDPAFQKVAEISAMVSFTNNGFTSTGRAGDTITRSDGGDWLADGFSEGSLLKVSGETANATGTSYYRVAAVTGTVLTLRPSDVLTTEAEPINVTITRGESPDVMAILIEERDDLDVNASTMTNVIAGENAFVGSNRRRERLCGFQSEYADRSGTGRRQGSP